MEESYKRNFLEHSFISINEGHFIFINGDGVFHRCFQFAKYFKKPLGLIQQKQTASKCRSKAAHTLVTPTERPFPKSN